jgi:hypothetical protein
MIAASRSPPTRAYRTAVNRHCWWYQGVAGPLDQESTVGLQCSFHVQALAAVPSHEPVVTVTVCANEPGGGR